VIKKKIPYPNKSIFRYIPVTPHYRKFTKNPQS